MSFAGRKLWDMLEESDVKYTTSFDRGGFKGTAVDAIYNVKRLTEHLGPVGQGWGWEVKGERLDTFGEGQDQQTIHSLTLRAWFVQDDGSVRHVEHIGHTKASYWSRPKRPGDAPRLVVDEEFGKKSLTDALSKVMANLGASADIWLGRFDGNKYVSPSQEREEKGAGEAQERVVTRARTLLGYAKKAADAEALREVARDVRGVFDDAPFWPALVHADRDLAAELQSILRAKAAQYGVDLSRLNGQPALQRPVAVPDAAAAVPSSERDSTLGYRLQGSHYSAERFVQLWEDIAGSPNYPRDGTEARADRDPLGTRALLEEPDHKADRARLYRERADLEPRLSAASALIRAKATAASRAA